MKALKKYNSFSFYSISVLIILISTVASLITIRRQDYLDKDVLKIHTILKELKTLSNSIVNAESNCRAYFITSDTTFLSNYKASVKGATISYNKLSYLIENKNNKSFFLLLFHQRIHLLNSGIRAKINDGKVPTVTIVKGNAVMRKLQLHIKDIEDKQLIKLEEEIRLLERFSDISKILILTLGIVAAIMTFFYRKRLSKSNSKNNRQSAIINAIPANIAMLNELGEITSVNEKWIDFAKENGYKSENYGIGQNYLKVTVSDVAEPERDEVANGIKAVINNKSSYYSTEYECSSPEKERWFKLMLVPLEGTEIPEYMVIHIDITEVKLAEMKVRQKEQALRTIAVINSHEIRKPLANILGLLDLIDSLASEEREEMLVLIRESAVTLDEKVKEIATMAN